jgi:outer membrane protein assembly factor BamB
MSIRRLLAALSAAVSLAALTALPAWALVDAVPRPSWGADDRVVAILQAGKVVYLAGRFTHVIGPTGQTRVRTHLAALDARTGDLLPWKPDLNGAAMSLAISPRGTTLFVGGAFTEVDGRKRSRLVAFDVATGQVRTRFKASASAPVRALAVRGRTLFVGGEFGNLDGEPRGRLGAVDTVEGSLADWYPGPADGLIRALAFAKGRLIVAGEFTKIGGHGERYLAAVDPSNGNVLGWRDHPDDYVIAMTVDPTGETVYAGGKKNTVVRYDAADGEDRWSSRGDGNIQALAVFHDVVYMGSHMDEFNGRPEPKLVALDPDNGRTIDWDGRTNSRMGVFAMDAGRGFLFIGGDFTRVAGRPQERFAMLPA